MFERETIKKILQNEFFWYILLIVLILILGSIPAECGGKQKIYRIKGNSYVKLSKYAECTDTVIHTKDMWNKARIKVYRIRKKVRKKCMDVCQTAGYVRVSKYERKYKISMFLNILMVSVIAIVSIIYKLKGVIYISRR